MSKRNLEHKKAYQKEYYLKNKEVLKAYRKRHYEENREKAIERSKDWVRRNPETRKRNILKSSHNISLETYNQMFVDQKGCCKCCGRHQSILPKGLFIDHCHITGNIRGLLCTGCNTALGMVKDNKQTLSNMIKYLEDSVEIKYLKIA